MTQSHQLTWSGDSASEQLIGGAAYEFANAPTFRGAMNAYFRTPPDLVSEPCGPWTMNITALGEDEIEEPSSSDSDEEEDIEWDESSQKGQEPCH
jgi:hypothetical protein